MLAISTISSVLIVLGISVLVAGAVFILFYKLGAIRGRRLGCQNTKKLIESTDQMINRIEQDNSSVPDCPEKQVFLNALRNFRQVLTDIDSGMAVASNAGLDNKNRAAAALCALDNTHKAIDAYQVLMTAAAALKEKISSMSEKPENQA